RVELALVADRQGVQPVRDHDLDVVSTRLPAAKPADRLVPPAREPFAGLRVEDVIGPVGRPGRDGDSVIDPPDERGGQLRPDAPLGVLVDAADRLAEPGLRIPGPLAAAPGDKDAVAADGLELRPAFRGD